LFELILAMVERKTPDIFEAQITALLDRPDASALLGTIRVPTLVMCGRQDQWSPVRQHEELAARVRDARLQVVEGAGHMLPMEQPEATAEAIAAWLAAQSSRH
jgi:pimeloyl-ACP methyl ester carboxylesterase